MAYTMNKYLTKQLNAYICCFTIGSLLEKCLDITIRQTIKRYYRLQQLELRFILQMEWCITHHIRAQYIETTLQCNEMKYSICSPILLGLVLKTMNCTILLSVFLLSLA